MRDFVELLPVILMPILVGTCFLGALRVGGGFRAPRSYSSLLIPAYLCGYLLQMCASAIPQISRVPELISFFLEAIVAIILGYGLGFVSHAKWVDVLLTRLRSGTRLHDDFWENIIDSKYGTNVQADLPDGRTITGNVITHEAYERRPVILLGDYAMWTWNENGEPVLEEDHQEENGAVFVLDTGNVTNLSFYYEPQSSKLVRPRTPKRGTSEATDVAESSGECAE